MKRAHEFAEQSVDGDREQTKPGVQRATSHRRKQVITALTVWCTTLTR